MQLKFLLGYSIFSVGNVTKKGFDKIIELVNNNRLTVGIYEGDKMNNIYRLLNINHSPDKYILNKSNQHVEITDEIKTQINRKKLIEMNVRTELMRLTFDMFDNE